MKAPTLQEWQAYGKYISILGHELFVIDEGDSKETIVVLHGFPSCSYDYYEVLPFWTKKYRVIIHDHPGFGLSSKTMDYSYSLIEQADVALALWKALGLEKVNLVAHDYGTSVATEIIARYNLNYLPIQLNSVTLGNGSMLIEMAKLLVTQKILRTSFWGPILAKFTSKAFFMYNFKKLWYDKSKINLEELNVLWEMLIHNNGRKVLPLISRYTFERSKFWHRWIGGLEKTDQHIHILWANKDPIAIYEMAKVLQEKIPNNTLTTIENVGHYPMLEAPEKYAEEVMKGIV